MRVNLQLTSQSVFYVLGLTKSNGIRLNVSIQTCRCLTRDIMVLTIVEKHAMRLMNLAILEVRTPAIQNVGANTDISSSKAREWK